MRREGLVDQRPSRVEDVSNGVLLPTAPPKVNAKWHPIAKRLWDSFGSSGQVHWWQDTDWALAYSVCDDLSRYKRQEDAAEKTRRIAEDWDKSAASLKPAERVARGYSKERPHVASYGSAMKMKAIYDTMASLLVTESDRRRVRIELQMPVDEDTSPVDAVMDEYLEGLEKA
jgi:hypothetical protein